MSDTALLSSASTFGVEALRSAQSFFNFMLFPIILVFLGLILYYFSGNKKHAEEFMPKLMSVGIRVNNYIWLLVASVTSFVGLYSVLFYIVSKLWPGDNAYVEPEFETFVRGLVVLLIGLIVMTFHYVLNSKVKTAEEKKGTVATKVYTTFGMAIFGIILFVSLLTVSSNILDKIYDEIDYVSASAIAVMLSSAVFWAIYTLKALKVFKNEPKQ